MAISPITCKVCEHCILEKFQSLLTTSRRQFGFKKGTSCSHAIRVVSSITLHVAVTLPICALLTCQKAFDKVNHHALYLRLMKRFIPNALLSLLECWLSSCYSCVKWDNAWSEPFHLSFGVRKGLVVLML